MAKLSFSKLGLSKNTSVNNIEFNGQNIEIKQYLPINDKAILASNVLNYAIGDGIIRFVNPLQVEVYTLLQVIEKYTNINFTDKQKEDPAKLYDLIVSSGLWNIIFEHIDKNDYNIVINYINKSIESFYNYYNSIYCILENINKQYEIMDLDATKIQEKLNDPQNMSLLKEVLEKLG